MEIIISINSDTTPINLPTPTFDTSESQCTFSGGRPPTVKIDWGSPPWGEPKAIIADDGEAPTIKWGNAPTLTWPSPEEIIKIVLEQFSIEQVNITFGQSVQ